MSLKTIYVKISQKKPFLFTEKRRTLYSVDEVSYAKISSTSLNSSPQASATPL